MLWSTINPIKSRYSRTQIALPPDPVHWQGRPSLSLRSNPSVEHSRLGRPSSFPNGKERKLLPLIQKHESKIKHSLHFTLPAPPATKRQPLLPIKSTAQAPPKHNPSKARCNWLPPTPPITPTDYAWLVPGLQTRSNSNRLLSEANASNPRRRFPSVLSPQ